MSATTNMIARTRSRSTTNDPASLFYHYNENEQEVVTDEESVANVEGDRNEFNNRGIYYGCTSVAFADLNYSMLVAFFPASAKRRALNATWIGMLFSVYQLANLITCFFVPKVNRRFGGVKVLAFANLMQGLFTATMASTGYLNSRSHFFAACFCLRSVQGSMAALSEISASGIVMRSVPVEYAGEVVLYIETFRIVGTLAGPLIGGSLYGALGYGGPFVFAGSILVLLSLFMFSFPLDKTVDNKSEGAETDEENKAVVKKYTRMTSVICLFVCILIVSASFTFMEPTLQPYLKKEPYNLSSTMVGVVFICATMIFFLSAEIAEPIILWLGDIKSLIFCFFMIALSYFLIAPPQHFDHTPLTIFAFCRVNKQVPATIFLIGAMAINWFGGGVLLALVNKLMVSEGKKAGFTVKSISDAIGMVLNIAFTGGATIGPLMGGFLTHHLDFPRSNAVFAYTVLGLSLIIAIALIRTFEGRANTASSTDTDTSDETSAIVTEDKNNTISSSALTNDPTKPLLDEHNII